MRIGANGEEVAQMGAIISILSEDEERKQPKKNYKMYLVSRKKIF